MIRTPTFIAAMVLSCVARFDWDPTLAGNEISADWPPTAVRTPDGLGTPGGHSIIPTGALSVPAPTTLAYYPLLTDLLDASGNNGPVVLRGDPVPPAPPADGVCVNGIYFYASRGQDVTTPNIATLDTTDFQLEVDFKLSALPATGFGAPVIMGGNQFRWIGIYVQSNGTVGVRYNNGSSTWSSTTLIAGVWYTAALKYETGTVQLFINGDLVHQDTIGSLITGGSLNFTTNDFSSGISHNGCIRNLLIANDTTLTSDSPSAYTTFGPGCVGSLGIPALDSASGNKPILGNTFSLRMSNLPLTSNSAYLAFGFSRESWAGIPLPADLSSMGIWGCTLYVSVDVAFPLTSSGTTADFSFDIPNDAAIVGLQFFNQGLVLDPGVNPFLGGAVLTNARMGIVQASGNALGSF